MPPAPPLRRLNLGDLAIVIAAVAGFLTLARRTLEHGPEVIGFYRFRGANGNQTGVFHPSDFAVTEGEIMGQGLMVASLVVIAIRLRQPRPRWGRLMRQPGWVAAATGLLAAFLCFGAAQARDSVATVSIRQKEPTTVGETLRLTLFPDEAATACGLAVLLAWLVLRGTGVGRPERSAIDRLGRLVGVGWIALPLVRLVWGLVRIVWS